MAEVRWAVTALSDLDEIEAYIAAESPRNAAVVIERLLRAAERLATFPMLGRVVPVSTRRETRVVIVGRHRLVYAVRRDTVEIIRIQRGTQLLRLGSD